MFDLIDLNVGGVLFTTSRLTLTILQGSMLEKMFNGNWDLTRDSQGRAFLDRDGNLFRYVLNFLRTGELHVPDDFSELQQLLCEADFYQIEPLIHAVKNEISRRRDNLKEISQPKKDPCREYYLDVLETTRLKSSAPIAERCEKEMVFCGNLTVLQSLPIDTELHFDILDISNRKETFRGHQFLDFNHFDCILSGDSVQIFLKTFKTTPDGSWDLVGLNRSDLADTLLAHNCTLVSSSSDMRKPDEDTTELQCWEKWRIPEGSLAGLSKVPSPGYTDLLHM